MGKRPEMQVLGTSAKPPDLSLCQPASSSGFHESPMISTVTAPRQMIKQWEIQGSLEFTKLVWRRCTQQQAGDGGRKCRCRGR